MILNEIKHQGQLIFLMKSSIKHQGVFTSKLPNCSMHARKTKQN